MQKSSLLEVLVTEGSRFTDWQVIKGELVDQDAVD